MKKIVTNELLFLQRKLEDLDTKEYKAKYGEGPLNIFRQDIINTMGLLVKIEMARS